MRQRAIIRVGVESPFGIKPGETEDVGLLRRDGRTPVCGQHRGRKMLGQELAGRRVVEATISKVGMLRPPAPHDVRHVGGRFGLVPVLRDPARNRRRRRHAVHGTGRARERAVPAQREQQTQRRQ
jgi:hypothetical protein